VPPEEVTFGHVVAEECARLGLSVDDYLDRYDPTIAQPFLGVDEMLQALPVPWAVCSNKVGRWGHVELDRLGWSPVVALFAEDFGGPKRLGPVLDALGVAGPDVIFVGDTAHDRRCATAVGARFAMAMWNPRASGDAAEAGDALLRTPEDLLGLLDLAG
jgi:phosphoglycolate phosphatase-like HAD superfamily hydrolase